MIDALVKVCEKLVELLKHRSELKEKAFSKQIEPLFSSMKDVHDDYLQLFSECRRELATATKLADIVERLIKTRLENEGLRQSILAMCSVLDAQRKPDVFRDFFAEVQRYFRDSRFEARDTRASMLIGAMERWVQQERIGGYMPRSFNPTEARSILIETVDGVLGDLRAA
jgi:hypothetical protein